MESIENSDLQLAFDFVQYTNRNIFLTGKAGTGKTTFLHNLKKSSPKRMIVVAPTGVAAINAGGVTIHSFFQLPFHPHIPLQYVSDDLNPESHEAREAPTFKMSRDKISIMKSLDLLVIDEISMVRADLLDAVDGILRRYKNRNKPFGGVQLLMIGDLQQLAPVVKEEDRTILDRYYDTAFFFGSHALRSTDYVTIELKHIYRQKDQAFITLLNKIRNNQLDTGALAELNKRYIPEFNADSNGGYITLTTHNAQAQSINNAKLAKLPGKVHIFEAKIRDDFPEYAYPTLKELELKVGAQVMFVKNDISREKLFYNGKIGTIEDIDEEGIVVQCAGDEDSILVQMAEWQNVKYSINNENKDIEETIIGTFTQYPLKLAWAITIHKSQGLTFDKAIIDARDAFAHGQVYVALSRCRTLDGVVLSTPVSQRGIFIDPTVTGFVQHAEQNQPDHQQLQQSKKAYQHMLLMELFDFSSIMQGLFYGLKLVREHADSLQGNPAAKLEEMIAAAKTDLVGVSAKFQPQLNRILAQQEDAETNPLLQERVIKGCAFFEEKMKNALGAIMDGMVIETDNTAARKSITESLDRTRQEINMKRACLKAIGSGFTIRRYLDTKAKAAIERPAIAAKVTAKSVEIVDGDIRNPELYGILKAWRDEKAREENVAFYLVLHLNTIATLSGFLPRTPEALRQVKGMGKKKAEKYGDELLEIITDYCLENRIEGTSQPMKAEKKPKKEKEDTRRVSLDLFKAGKPIIQIAEIREMTVGTIEGHLAYYVGKGDLSVNEFVAPDVLGLILNQLDQMQELKAGQVKEALGDQVSWSDIKFVIKHVESLKR
jgi:hypothetical protein